MWIPLTLLCAATQATWMALSKLRLQTLGRIQLTVFLRVPIVFLMLPAYLAVRHPTVPRMFWLLLCAVSLLECGRMLSLATGLRKDYYATYALMNTAPLWVLLLAPSVLGERLTLPVLGGAAFVVSGGFVFYRTGRLIPAGLAAAVIEGLIAVLSKRAMALCATDVPFSAPVFFMFWMYLLATVLMSATEGVRAGVGPTLTDFRRALKPILPLSAFNVVAMFSYMAALHLAHASRFAILMRCNLVFGFVLSLTLLHEFAAWQWRLVGALLIVAGAALIVLA